MANASKQKGSRGEYEVCDLLNPILQEEAKRFGVPNGLQWLLRRNVDQSGRGVKGLGGCDLEGVSWLGIEVKRVEVEEGSTTRYMLDQWWLQTKSNAAKRAVARGLNGNGSVVESGEVIIDQFGGWVFDKEPVLIWRRNNQPWNVRMFGYLLANPDGLARTPSLEPIQGLLRVRSPVDINIAAFLAYFRVRCQVELMKEGRKISV